MNRSTHSGRSVVGGGDQQRCSERRQPSLDAGARSRGGGQPFHPGADGQRPGRAQPLDRLGAFDGHGDAGEAGAGQGDDHPRQHGRAADLDHRLAVHPGGDRQGIARSARPGEHERRGRPQARALP
jgi:hypothetical protein